MNVAGIDIGSITAKAAFLADGRILGTKVTFTGYNSEQAGKTVFEDLLEELNMDVSSIHRVVSTGYGRNSVKFADKAITEIICHGTGAYYLSPHVRSVIDVGGQDSKVIVIGPDGNVRDFVMNDKCAGNSEINSFNDKLFIIPTYRNVNDQPDKKYKYYNYRKKSDVLISTIFFRTSAAKKETSLDH